MKQSKRFQFNKTDAIAWGKQTLWFLAPFILALMPVLISKVPSDWEYGVITLWVLNRVWDFFRRWYTGK